MNMPPNQQLPPDASGPDRLSAEERAMAARLGRPAPGDGPSAALDASILSAARTATAHQPRRWPATFGIAATLVVAAGLVWQLRPVPQRPDAQPEVAVAAAGDQAGPTPARAARPAAVRPAAVRSDSAVPATAASDAAADVAPPANARTAAPTHKALATQDNAGAAPVSQDRSTDTPVRAAAMESAAADLPTSPRPAAGNDAARQSRAIPLPAGAPRQPQALEPASEPSRREPMAVREAAAPPAGPDTDTLAADERLLPDAWLDRIRQRRDAGDLAGAHESLQRFRTVHPDRPLPPDLRTLLNLPAQ